MAKPTSTLNLPYEVLKRELGSSSLALRVHIRVQGLGCGVWAQTTNIGTQIEYLDPQDIVVRTETPIISST